MGICNANVYRQLTFSSQWVGGIAVGLLFKEDESCSKVNYKACLLVYHCYKPQVISFDFEILSIGDKYSRVPFVFEEDVFFYFTSFLSLEYVFFTTFQ